MWGFFSRDAILAGVQRLGGVKPIDRLLELLGTGRERLLFFLLIVFSLLLISGLSRLVRREWGRWAIQTVAFLFLLLLGYGCVGSSYPVFFAFLLAGLLSANSLPSSWLIQAMNKGRIADTLFGLGVGLTELLLPRPFLMWLFSRVGARTDRGSRLGSQGGSLIVYTWVAALFALSLPFSSLSHLALRLFPDESVRPFAVGRFEFYGEGDLNWLALDGPRQRLYACGHGTDSLLVFDTADLARSPERVGGANNHSQGCGFDPEHDELYIYHRSRQELTTLDAATFQLKLASRLAIASGDFWIEENSSSDRIFICSEVDRPDGIALGVLDRKTGALLGTLSYEAGFVLSHPRLSRLYMTFFRAASGIVSLDTMTLREVAQVGADPRIDRIAWDPRRNELLVPSPVHSRIQRYDAVTLKKLGDIPTLFGARAVAVDSRRDFALSASVLNGDLVVVDLKTGKKLARYRLGPWPRSIAVDEERGIAYVSSPGAIYAVHYTDRIPPSVH